MDLTKLDSIWKEKHSGSWAFYCPSCRAARKIPYQPRPTPRHYAQVAAAAAFFTLLTWSWFTWKGIVSFLPMWTAFEIFYRARMRGALSCSHCGFDPYLYLIDVPRAREAMEAHWRKKFAEKGIPYPDKPGPGAKQAAREQSQ